jgi:hypothetical protein
MKEACTACNLLVLIIAPDKTKRGEVKARPVLDGYREDIT